MNTKRCNKCKLIKSANKEYFHWRNDTGSWRNTCILCRREKEKARHGNLKKRSSYYCDGLYKQCYKCLKTQHIEQFQLRSDTNKSRNSCKGCDKLKGVRWRGENITRYRAYKGRYYFNNKEHIKRKTKENRYRRLQTDVCFKLKCSVSKAVYRGLKSNGGSKAGEPILKHLPYTMVDLKRHLESQFELWMGWDNWGLYKRGADRVWQIDHITPQSALKYDSFSHPNFKKCWDLNNLRPLDGRDNIEKSNKMI